jgi:flagellar motor switch protein FliN/FliY
MADENIPSDPTAAPSDGGTPSETDPLAAFDPASIDELLKQASFDDPNAVAGVDFPAEVSSGGVEVMDPMAALAAAGLPIDAAELKLPTFQQVMQDAQVSSIDLLRDVELNVKIELGRSRMLVEDVLKLSEGSVVELDKLAGDPVDVFVNERLVARGEVLVLNDNFCVRVNEIVAAAKEEAM